MQFSDLKALIYTYKVIKTDLWEKRISSKGLICLSGRGWVLMLCLKGWGQDFNLWR